MKPRCCFIAVALACATAGALPAAEVLRVQGSPTLAQAVSLATPAMKADFGIEMKLSLAGGSSQAIYAVGSRTADVAMSTRPLTGEDRATFPARRFEEVQVGTQALVLVVPRDVWDAGVRALTKEQLLAIYEGEVTNWKPLGGEDRPIKFYSPERGQGLWELYVTWLYGDSRRAPLGKFEIVRSSPETRDTVEFNGGSFSLIPPAFVDGKSLFALGIRQPDGSIVEPTAEKIASRAYPLTRPLYLIVGDKPTGAVKKLLDLMLSPRGQAFVKKAEFTPIQ